MMTQDEALKILKTGANVFLTGEPGSGKTHTVNAYVSWLRERGIEPSITASTGIAATHIGGYTIHSWSGIGIRKDLTDYDLDFIAQNKRVTARVQNSSILIIDEVSMLSARVLSMVDAVCRELRRDPRAFGGLQVVLVGDFFQLPPVNRRDADEQESLAPQNPNQFAYLSPAWSALNPLVCYLSEQHRQEDAAFLDFLTAVRKSAVAESHKQLLRTRYSPKPKGGITQLYSHNADVDRINDDELGKISEDVQTFEMTGRGPEKLVASLKRGCLSPETLSLKIGARVMFTKNDMMHRYVNGTLGIVTGFSKENGFPIVETNSGRIIVAEPDEWRIEDGGRVLARIMQIPIRLAWAMTVHKSQGMSLDAAHMDLSDVFEYGQGYVALSRVRTLAGLSLAGLNKRALEVHPEILAKDAELRAKSESARATFSNMSQSEIAALHSNFVRASGGKIGRVITPPPKSKPRGATLDVTFALLKSGKSLHEIAKERSLMEGTILSHLEELQKTDRITSGDILPLARDKKEIIAKIHDAFRSLGKSPMKPVFDHLKGSASYDTIRLARMLYDQ